MVFSLFFFISYGSRKKGQKDFFSSFKKVVRPLNPPPPLSIPILIDVCYPIKSKQMCRLRRSEFRNLLKVPFNIKVAELITLKIFNPPLSFSLSPQLFHAHIRDTVKNTDIVRYSPAGYPAFLCPARYHN